MAEKKDKKPNFKARIKKLTSEHKGMTFIIVVLLIFTIVPWTINLFKGYHAKREVTYARHAAEEITEKKLKKEIAFLKELGITESVASSKVDTCSIDSSDSGWFANTYYQYCTLQYTEGFVTELTKPEVIKRLQSSQTARELFGELRSSETSCMIFWDNAHTSVFLMGEKNEDSSKVSCYAPGQYSLIEIPKKSVKVFYGFDKSSAYVGKTQLWITHENRYYHEDLGCSFPEILFCYSPRNKPVQAP